MFLDEARLAARISHPNVTQIFDLGQEGSEYFMAMEYVAGWDLNIVLKQCAKLAQPLPIHLAARVAADICAGLHAAHSCTDEAGAPLAIVHRDVSGPQRPGLQRRAGEADGLRDRQGGGRRAEPR